LPEDVAAQARAAGLLEPECVATLIARELSLNRDPKDYFELIRHIRAQPGEPMTPEEIEAEIHQARADRSGGEARR
jgi:hypothetical protein